MTGKTLLHRLGWQEYLRPFLFKKLPPSTSWFATLGTMCAVLFALLVVTGMMLAMYYCPSPDKAYQSIDFIMQEVPLGRILRGLHHFGAGAMVLLVFLHLLAVFFSGSFKAPRELTWIVGVCLLICTLGLGFTGYLLPWDMKAYWATVVSTNIPRDIPLVGDGITRIALGGDTVSGLTLTRFYAIHTLVLPALLCVFAAIHIYLVRVHGLAEHTDGETPEKASESQTIYRFYPEHMFRSVLVFTVLFLLLLLLAAVGTVPREEIAGTLIDAYLPRPEWYYMWLFQMLTFFSGAWESVGSLAVPCIGIVLVFAVPFLTKSPLTGAAKRPLAMGIGVTAVMAIVYLTLMGFEGAMPYGQVIPVPDRPLNAAEKRGLFLYADRECAYCHQIMGKGGHRTGPDMSNIPSDGRTKEYLAKFVKDPQAVSSTSIMPKYDLPEADLKALADFMLGLDFSSHPVKLLKREDVLSKLSAATGQKAGTPGEQAHW